jgi:preprotein translocase subunit SecE
MVNPVTYVKESMQEMKKVTWPTKKETKNYTILIVAISLATAAFLGALDFFFTFALENLLGK